MMTNTTYSKPSLEEGLPNLLAETWKCPVLFGGCAWLSVEQAEVYFRIGPRLVRDESLQAPVFVTIANINTPEKFERTGIFTRMIPRIKAITRWPLYLEGVRPDFAVTLTAKYGWVRDINPYPQQINLILKD